MRKTYLFCGLIGVGLILGLGACTTSQPYGPASSDRAQGYSERAIEDGRYRVTYRATSQMSARDGALRRAAELTVAQGGEWFQITNSYSDEVERRSGPSVGIGGSTGSRHSGVGVGISLPLGGSSMTEHSIEFVIGEGDKPEGADAYDAESVLGAAGEG